MDKYLIARIIIEFIGVFLIIYLYYRLIALKKIKLFKKEKDGKLKDTKNNEKTKDKLNKDNPEVKLFINVNKIDLTKVNYSKVARQIAFMVSFNIALTIVLVFELFDSVVLKIFVGLVSLTVTTILGYKILGYFYQKKGLTTCTTLKK